MLEKKKTQKKFTKIKIAVLRMIPGKYQRVSENNSAAVYKAVGIQTPQMLTSEVRVVKS